jgi:DNA polymerase III subunit alpha
MDEFKGEKYVNLHNHSYYSILDGLSSPNSMVDACINNNSRALALTDHGTCSGWYSFQKACISKGVKPILGNEVYICNDHKSRDPKDPRYHLILLAKNQAGIQNLMELSTISETSGKYKKPRIDLELLKNHHEGLICMSACCIGELPTLLWHDDNDGAIKLANQYKDLFGDDYYIEIMMHKYNENSKDQEKRERVLAKRLYDLSKQLKIKAVCSNDAHYAHKHDATYHDVMLSMQTHSHIKDPKRFTFNGEEFYLKTYEEMYALYKSAPELITNTVEISEKIEKDAILFSAQDLLPNFNLPDGFTSESEYLKVLVKEGMIKYGFINNSVYRERIKMEMGLIIRCGFVKYFLILWDIINYARQQGIRVGIGRGSGAGSLCLYCLGITKLDPIKYDLLFERFINPERVSPPDVDIDFDYYRRDEIFDYIIRKYGSDYCCKIGTYNTFKAKAAVKYAAKALDIGNDWDIYQQRIKKNPDIKVEMTKNSLNLADDLSKQIPEVPGTTIEMALKENESLRNNILKYPKLLETVRRVEGSISSAGVHAAGIVVCKNPIYQHIPLRESKGAICSQFVMSEVEDLGLLKLDMLALKTLTIIENTIQMIKSRSGVEIDIDNLEPNDPNVFKLFNGGYSNMDTKGIFQFESPGISKLLKSIRIDTFYDIVVCNALYRPGPLGAGVHDLYSDYKHGRKPIKYLHPKMGEALKKTYGAIIFQEDVMKIAQVLAGFTLGQADILRKVIGKKKTELIKKEKLDEKFINGCKEHSGIDADTATKIFEQIEYFGGYGFNVAHAACYSMLAYQTAWLKVYYPLEYMCNLLSSEIDSKDKGVKLQSYINETRRMNILIKDPDINKSGLKYSISKFYDNINNEEKFGIRSPLTMLAGVGEKAVEDIVANQPFKDLGHFLRSVDTRKVNSKVFETLVRYNCMKESWGLSAEKLMEQYKIEKEGLDKEKKQKKKNEERIEVHGGNNIFSAFGFEEFGI